MLTMKACCSKYFLPLFQNSSSSTSANPCFPLQRAYLFTFIVECWHQILARSRTYLRWPQMEKWSTWKSSILLIWTSLKFGPSPSDFILKAESMLKVLRSYIQSTVWPIKPPRRPQMEKPSTQIVFVSLKQAILIQKSSQSEVVCKSYSHSNAALPGGYVWRATQHMMSNG